MPAQGQQFIQLLRLAVLQLDGGAAPVADAYAYSFKRLPRVPIANVSDLAARETCFCGCSAFIFSSIAAILSLNSWILALPSGVLHDGQLTQSAN